jgi:hypothetical protein
MIKRFLPVALLLAWAPAALAFPPCPKDALQIQPLGSALGTTEAWFDASYEMAGNDDIIGELKSANSPSTGKCKDRVPVPQGNTSGGNIELNPSYAKLAGFGIISLPELPTVARDQLRVTYRLDFKIDNAALARTGDWIDVTQLEFAHDRKEAGERSAVYRVRKIQRGKGPATVEVIESRAPALYTKPPLVDRVVAEIPLVGANGKTAIALLWTQLAQKPLQAESKLGQSPMAVEYAIDSVLQVLGPGKEAVATAEYAFYSTSLPRQWADTLSMGLLDYNVPDDSAYGSEFRLVSDDVELSAKEF